MNDPNWWLSIRRIVTFLLGCTVIVDALLQTAIHTGELIVGLILIGVLPIDDLLRIFGRTRNGGHDDD